MTNKLKVFISSLTNKEIEEQLSDIFGWAKQYQEYLEEELRQRQNHSIRNWKVDEDTFDYIDEEYDENFEHFETDETNEISIDFNLAVQIQGKVESYTKEETETRIEELKEMLTRSLSEIEIEIINFELEECEFHLAELVGGVTNDISTCPICGKAVILGAKFCGGCGAKIS